MSMAKNVALAERKVRPPSLPCYATATPIPPYPGVSPYGSYVWVFNQFLPDFSFAEEE